LVIKTPPGVRLALPPLVAERPKSVNGDRRRRG
jgi:hypothetical protein